MRTARYRRPRELFPCPVCGEVFNANLKQRQAEFTSCPKEPCVTEAARRRHAKWHNAHPSKLRQQRIQQGLEPAPVVAPKVERKAAVKDPSKRCICRHPSSHSYVCSMARQGKSVTRDPRIMALAEREALAA